MSKNTYIVAILCLAVFMKLSFFNISFLLTGNLEQIESLSSNAVFKVGKSRRRVMDYMAQADDRRETGEQAPAELPGNTEYRVFGHRFRFPLISFFRQLNTFFNQQLYWLSAKHVMTFAESPFDKLPSVSYLRLAVLRI